MYGFLSIFFLDNKEEGRRHTDVWQVLLTQLAKKIAKKPHVAKMLNRLLNKAVFLIILLVNEKYKFFRKRVRGRTPKTELISVRATARKQL